MSANDQMRGLSFVEVDIVVDEVVEDAKVVVDVNERPEAPDLLLLLILPGFESFSGSEEEFLTLLSSFSADEDVDKSRLLMLMLSPADEGEVDEEFRR